MAISPREVVRSTSCLVIYGGVFVVGGSNGAISGFAKSKMAARPPSGSAAILENSKGDIYPADRPIYTVFGSNMGFSGLADFNSGLTESSTIGMWEKTMREE